MWLRTWLIFWKEFKQISRDPRLIGVVIGLPMVTLILYGYAFNLDVKHVRLAVYDQDHSHTSRDLINAFIRNEYFDLVLTPSSYSELTRDIDGGKAVVGLVIPTRFAAGLAAGGTAQILLIIDGSDSTTATTALSYAATIVQQFSTSITFSTLRQSAGGASGGEPVDNRERFWYNPELKSTDFFVPGLIAIILSSLSSLLTSVTVARERERGTMESCRLPGNAAGIDPRQVIPYVIVALGDVVLVMIAGITLFHVPLRGSPLLVVLCAFFFLLATQGLGMYISVISPMQQLAQTIASFTTQLPTVFLSGFVFPINSMPLVIQWLTVIVPATYFIKILRAIFLKGSGLSLIWPYALVLLLMGLSDHQLEYAAL